MNCLVCKMFRKGKIEAKVILAAVILLFVCFLVVPMIFLLVKSFSSGGGFSFAAYGDIFTSQGFWSSMGNSFLVSACAAFITTSLAFFLAYAMNHARMPKFFQVLVKNITVAPMFLPSITYGFIIIYSLGKEGLITHLFGGQLFSIYGFSGLLLGYIIYTLPITFMLIHNSFQYVDKNYIIVSKVMGDSGIRTFFMTAVRPLVGTMGAAFIQSFTLSFTDFGIPTSIGGQYDVVATRLYNEMLGSIPNFPGGAATALMMLIPAIFSIIMMNVLQKYNFRYNKVSKVVLEKSPVRDTICMVGSGLISLVTVALFLVMFLVPFVKQWPYDFSFTFEHIISVFTTGNLLSVYGNSLMVAFATAVLGVLVSYGAALVTARAGLSPKLTKIVDAISMITNTVPGMVLGIGFLFAFSGTGIQNTFFIIIICNIVHFFTTPYLMAKNALEKMNGSWESTAALMGDSWIKTLIRVVIPNSFTTILEMLSYYFINAMVTISAVVFLTGAHTMVLTTKIKELQHYARFDEIFVLSLLILFTNVVVKVVLALMRKHAEKPARVKSTVKRGIICEE